MSQFVNIAGYKFVELDFLPQRREALLQKCKELEMKGTILVSREGINLFLAASRKNIDLFLDHLRSDPCFTGFQVKESFSDGQPFNRLLVRIKKEIIAFGVEGIEPQKRTSPKLKPSELKKWLDEGKPVTLLDVRNNYEVELGTFENAVVANIDHFRQFPEAVENLDNADRDKPVVMFCTGGIRCEKAGPFMEQAGFNSVFQLDGGILQYFEDVGGEHYDGDCFVFDQRVAVDPGLAETDAEVCFACQAVLFPDDLNSPKYVAGVSCHHCFKTETERLEALRESRESDFRKVANPLPGSIPYDNYRPINVPLRFTGFQLLDFLDEFHPHVGRSVWEKKITLGEILYSEQPLQVNSTVRQGQRIEHLIPAMVEPDVNAAIELIYEDEALVVINKPAPLPMHPSGRFNRNTLTWILDQVYDHQLRISHRLDANTTGLVAFSRTRKIASIIQPQFEKQLVSKTYLARVYGKPTNEKFEVNLPITDQPTIAGGRRIETGGKECLTRFELIGAEDADHVFRLPEGESLVKAMPVTGRTNQIRIHLWQSDLPIVGDPTYLPNRQMAARQTRHVNDPPMCLHAWRLKLTHPLTNKPVEFEAPLPAWAIEELADMSVNETAT